MKQYFDFNGTAKRQEYWAVYLLSVLALAVGTVIVEGAGALGALIALIILVGALWALLATTVRRLRDAGLNMWWVIVILVPYISFIATIVFGVVKSKED
jgi:uncharacterized membrane protein YhaH (DUF805 family)